MPLGRPPVLSRALGLVLTAAGLTFSSPASPCPYPQPPRYVQLEALGQGACPEAGTTGQALSQHQATAQAHLQPQGLWEVGGGGDTTECWVMAGAQDPSVGSPLTHQDHQCHQDMAPSAKWGMREAGPSGAALGLDSRHMEFLAGSPPVPPMALRLGAVGRGSGPGTAGL